MFSSWYGKDILSDYASLSHPLLQKIGEYLSHCSLFMMYCPLFLRLLKSGTLYQDLIDTSVHFFLYASSFIPHPFYASLYVLNLLIFPFLMIRFLSRVREYLADDFSIISKGASPLRHALIDIKQRKPWKTHFPSLSIVSFQKLKKGVRGFFQRLLSTHPPFKSRISSAGERKYVMKERLELPSYKLSFFAGGMFSSPIVRYKLYLYASSVFNPIILP